MKLIVVLPLIAALGALSGCAGAPTSAWVCNRLVPYDAAFQTRAAAEAEALAVGHTHHRLREDYGELRAAIRAGCQ